MINSTASHLDRDIALVLDRSGSMVWTLNSNRYPRGWRSCDPIPNGARWLDLVMAVDGFLQELEDTPQDEYVSMSSYSSKSRIDLQLTDNYRSITKKVDNLTDRFCGGSTNITSGMNHGIKTLTNTKFARPYAVKTLVVMTDGNHNTGNSPVNAAKKAARNNITVHTITFSNGANKKLMKQVAALGDGQHWHAPTGEELEDIFREIARNAPTLLTY